MQQYTNQNKSIWIAQTSAKESLKIPGSGRLPKFSGNIFRPKLHLW